MKSQHLYNISLAHGFTNVINGTAAINSQIYTLKETIIPNAKRSEKEREYKRNISLLGLLTIFDAIAKKETP